MTAFARFAQDHLQPLSRLVSNIYLRTALMLLLLLGLAVAFHRFIASSNIPIDIDISRNYKLAPFDIIDAADACRAQTQQRFGNSLARSYMDEHSTRWDDDAGLYKIFMFAYTGSTNHYKEVAVHCFVDPKKHVLAYYRTIDLNKTSLVSKALKFFE